MTSKAARRKAKKSAGKQSSRDMKSQWRSEVVTHNRPMPTREEVREVVREARARHLSMQASDIMDAPMLGEQAGRAICIGATDEAEAERLWETFKIMDAAAETYARRILGRSRFPAVAKMEYLPERFETRADDRIDIRTPEEKDASAKKEWLRWCDLSANLQPPLHAALHMSLRHKVQLHQGRGLTGAGRLFLAAIRRIDSLYRGVDG